MKTVAAQKMPATDTRPTLAVLTRHFSPSAGGAEAYSYRVVEQLASRFAITVMAQSFGAPIDGVNHQPMPWIRWLPRWLNQWHYSLATAKACHGFDLVHSHENTHHGQLQTLHVQTVRSNLFGLQAKRAKWVGALKLATSPRLWFYWRMEQARLTQAAQHVVFASDALRTDALQNWPALSEMPTSVLPPATHTHALTASGQKSSEKEAAKRRWPDLSNLPIDASWLLFAANDWKKKGLDTALTALAQLPNRCHLLIAGKLDQAANFRQALSQEGIEQRCHVLGPVDELPKLYLACDALLHPTWQDAAPMVVLEAMGHGLPVVTTAAPHNGLSADLTDGVEVLLLPEPGHAPALAQAVRMVLAQPEATEARRVAAHAFASQRSWSALAKRYEVLLLSVLANTKQKS